MLAGAIDVRFVVGSHWHADMRILCDELRGLDCSWYFELAWLRKLVLGDVWWRSSVKLPLSNLVACECQCTMSLQNQITS